MANVMNTIRGYRPSSLRVASLEPLPEERERKELNIRMYQERARLHLPLFVDAPLLPDGRH